METYFTSFQIFDSCICTLQLPTSMMAFAVLFSSHVVHKMARMELAERVSWFASSRNDRFDFCGNKMQFELVRLTIRLILAKTVNENESAVNILILFKLHISSIP